MEFKTVTIQDRTGAVVPNAPLRVYVTGTNYTTLAAGVVDASGAATNPVMANASGQATIGAPDGIYDLRGDRGDGTYFDLPKQQFFDQQAAIADAVDATATDAAATAADRLQTAIDRAAAETAESGAEDARDVAEGYQASIASIIAAGFGVAYQTRAELYADLVPAVNTLGFVVNDGTVDNNGTYIKVGASGAGSWQIGVDKVAIEAAARAVAIESLTASAPLSSGDLFSTITYYPSLANGAVNNGAGLTIPSGQTGAGSFVQMDFPFDPAGLVGRRIRITMLFSTSEDAFLSAWNKHLYRFIGATSTNNAEVSGSGVLQQLSSTVGRYDIDYLVLGTETALRPYLQRPVGAGVAAADIVYQLVGIRFSVIADSADSTTGSDPLFDRRAAAMIAAAIAAIPAPVTTITQGAIDNSRYAFSAQALNGSSVVSDDDDVAIGIAVPSGSTGASALVTYYTLFTDAELSALIGRTIKFTVILDTSSDIASVKPFRIGNVNVRLNDGTLRSAQGTQSATSMPNSNKAKIEYTYEIVGDESKIGPVVQFTSGAGDSGVDVSFALAEFGYELVAIESNIESPSDQNIDLRIKRAVEGVGAYSDNSDYVGLVTVAVDGSADFTSVSDAVDSIVGAKSTARWKVLLMPGIDTVGDIQTKDWVDVIGADRYRSIMSLALPNDASAEEISLSTIFLLNSTTKLENMTLRLTNGRYVVHPDSSNVIKDGHWEINNCHLEHFGNDDAVNNTWGSQNGIGIGTSSGQTISCRGSTFKGPQQGFAWHTNKKFEKPSIVDLRDCAFIATNPSGNALGIRALGSLRTDLGYINGCEINGDIKYTWVPWYPTDLASQPANHAEVRLMGSGNSPAVFRITDDGRALKIESASVIGTSTIDVSGDAVYELFGQVYSIPGDGGIPGYVYGWADISGAAVGLNQDTVITKLGQRLGDCSGTSKTLTITIDGGTPIDIVFSVDYTASDNASILAIINDALGGNAIASEYAIGERYRPQFFDEEKLLVNNSAEGILMGMGCAYDEDHRNVRKMTAADDPSLFAGLAWEDIYPGQCGRVKFCGHVGIFDVLRTDSAAFIYGEGFSIDATEAGKWEKGGSQNLLTAIRSDAVRVGSAKR